ncbi:hypothetical protein HMI51_05340 [Corallococcus coralloides]|nr:hypothetical protein [Corallococcus coralloides]
MSPADAADIARCFVKVDCKEELRQMSDAYRHPGILHEWVVLFDRSIAGIYVVDGPLMVLVNDATGVMRVF